MDPNSHPNPLLLLLLLLLLLRRRQQQLSDTPSVP
jgi:MYXO-CTERM domain-containing protein